MTQIQNHKLEGTVKVPIPARLSFRRKLESMRFRRFWTIVSDKIVEPNSFDSRNGFEETDFF